jgi:hypothetical protein
MRKFHKVKDRPAWDYEPAVTTAGAIVDKSSASLQLWFYAMHPMASNRCAVSTRQVERERGVTYKTAWRVTNLIRDQLMTQDEKPLSGDVEPGETFISENLGSRPLGRPASAHPYRTAWKLAMHRKTPVSGAVERGGPVRTVVVWDSCAPTLRGLLHGNVLSSSTTFTDEWKGHAIAGRSYRLTFVSTTPRASTSRDGVHPKPPKGSGPP